MFTPGVRGAQAPPDEGDVERPDEAAQEVVRRHGAVIQLGHEHVGEWGAWNESRGTDVASHTYSGWAGFLRENTPTRPLLPCYIDRYFISAKKIRLLDCT